MGNLIRPINKYLLNSVIAADVPANLHEGAGEQRPLFIHTGLGICIPGNKTGLHPVMTVNVKHSKQGTKKVMKLVLAKLRNVTETQTEFFLNITKKASWNGMTNEVFDIPHSYNYVKKNFSTSSNGTFDETDVANILQTLVARINADKQLGDAHVSTGAAVVAAYVADAGSHGTYTDTPAGGTSVVTITADTEKAAVITLVHNNEGNVTVQDMIDAWNVANPANTASLIAGIGTQVPTANIILSAGVAHADAYITLTAKDAAIDFDVDVDATDFTLTTTTARVAPVGKWDDIARLFPVKAEDAGTLVNQPVNGTYYGQIEIVQMSVGAENAVASGTIGKEQRTIIYAPEADLDAHGDLIWLALIHAALEGNIYEDGVLWVA